MNFFSTVYLAILSAYFLGVILPAKVSSIYKIRKVLMLEYFKPCGIRNDLPISMHLSFTRNGSTIYLNGEQIVSRDIKDPLSIAMRIERCKDWTKSDHCEHYHTFNWKNMCSLRMIPPFKQVFDACSPPLACPIKKNTYYLKNAGSIDPDIYAAFFFGGSSHKALWKFHVTVQEEDDTVVSCVDMALRLAEMKTKLL